MRINKGVVFSVAAVMLASLFAYSAGDRGLAEYGGAPIEAYAANPDFYDAVVHYDDNIQITYLEMIPDGTFRMGPGDIQLGVLQDGSGNAIIQQLYCAAATVPFHGMSNIITHPPGQPLVDVAPGYVVASPETALGSDSNFARNMKQIMWLVAHGYYGDNTGLSVNNASVVDLVSRYPNIGLGDAPNRAVIALVATKISIWHFSDPMVSILSTSLAKEDQIKMYNLAKALIADANAYAAAPAPAPLGMSMDLVIDDSAAGFVTGSAFGNMYYYGPLEVVSTSSDINSKLDKILLELTGSNVGSSRFVKDEGGSPTTAALETVTDYGQPDTPYTHKSSFVMQGEQFWIEASEASCPDMTGIAVHATARANQVRYTQATPQLVVYGTPDGNQDWMAIQAFVGLMDRGATGDIFGEAKLELHGGVSLAPGHISLTKIMRDIDGNIVTPYDGDVFTVVLTPDPPSSTSPYAFTLNKANNWTVTEAAVTDGAYSVTESFADKNTRLIGISPAAVTIDRADPATSTVAIRVVNQRESGKVRIRKLVQNANGADIAPLDRDLFVFDLKPRGNNATTASIGMQGGIFRGASGYTTADITLPSGTYDVEEIVDDRYSLVSGESTIDIPTGGGVKELTVVNRQHDGLVKVKKVTKVNGETVTPSPGAVFVVSLTDERDPYHELTAELNKANNWEATFNYVPIGRYSVKEVRGGDGWSVSYSSDGVTVTDRGTHEFTVTNSMTVAPVDDDDEDDEDEDEDDTDETAEDEGSNSDTGDSMPLAMWTWLLIASGLGIVVAALLMWMWRRRPKKQ
jgi:hypothetical protein